MSRARQILQTCIPPRGWVIPTSGTLRKALPLVAGTYQMSRREVVKHILFAGMPIAVFGFVAGQAWNEFQQSERLEDAATAALGVIAVLLVAVWILPRIFARYELRDGFVSQLDRQGQVRWREDLANVPRVVLCTDNISTFITLRWPERRRTLVITDAFAEAIDEAQDKIDAAMAPSNQQFDNEAVDRL